MKRCILILSSVLILLTLCGCSNNTGINDEVKNTENSNTTEQESIMTATNTIKKANNKITVKIGDKEFTAQLYDNKTANAFSDMLPLTLDMNELHGNEKYYNLSTSLPTSSTAVGQIKNGDIMLYGDNCIVLFYDSFSTQYSYTKIGYIENTSQLAETLGIGNITITFDK